MEKPLSYHIRPGRESDIDAIYGLILELAAFEGKTIDSLPCTKEHLIKFGFGIHSYFSTEVVEVENQLVGYALYYYAFSGHQGLPYLYVDDIYIKEAHRGNGIGSKLMKRLADYALERHCCRLEGYVFDWNTSALSWYQKLGAQFKKDLIPFRFDREALKILSLNEKIF